MSLEMSPPSRPPDTQHPHYAPPLSLPLPADTPTPSSHLGVETPAPSLLSDTFSPPNTTTRLDKLADSEAHQLQLGFWQEEEEVARSLIQRKEASRTDCQTEIYQLLALYFLFQGVVFSAVAQATTLSCQDWWSPFVLSLITSLATISAVWHKLAASARVGEELEKEKRHAEALYDMIFEMRAEGVEFDLNKQPEDNSPGGPELSFCQKYVYTYGAAVTMTLVLFSISNLLACKRVLCHRCSCSS